VPQTHSSYQLTRHHRTPWFVHHGLTPLLAEVSRLPQHTSTGITQGASPEIAARGGKDSEDCRVDVETMAWELLDVHYCSLEDVWVIDPMGTGAFTSLEAVSKHLHQHEQEVRASNNPPLPHQQHPACQVYHVLEMLCEKELTCNTSGVARCSRHSCLATACGLNTHMHPYPAPPVVVGAGLVPEENAGNV
jgi:hypothetical protein